MTKEEAAEILNGRNIVDREMYLAALKVAADTLCGGYGWKVSASDAVEGLCCDCIHDGPCCDYSENTQCEFFKPDGSCWQAYNAFKLDRSRWKGCENCTAGDGEFRCLLEKWGDGDYCSRCGRPLTEQAWAELERRIGGNDGTTD